MDLIVDCANSEFQYRTSISLINRNQTIYQKSSYPTFHIEKSLKSNTIHINEMVANQISFISKNVENRLSIKSIKPFEIDYQTNRKIIRNRILIVSKNYPISIFDFDFSKYRSTD